MLCLFILIGFYEILCAAHRISLEVRYWVGLKLATDPKMLGSVGKATYTSIKRTVSIVYTYTFKDILIQNDKISINNCLCFHYLYNQIFLSPCLYE